MIKKGRDQEMTGTEKTVTLDLLDFIKRELLTEAAEARENAGHSGLWSDGGATAIEREVKMYCHGYNRELPSEWAPYVTKFENSQDPEYTEYLRLKRKFQE